jgi:RND family efflux transporter MFP subunit
MLSACGDTESAEGVDLVDLPVAVDKMTTIPTVQVVTATSGRLPLRRKANGLLRARREITVKSLASGLLTTAPHEGKYYRKGELLAATDVRALELAVTAREIARDEAEFKHRDLLVRMGASVTEDTLSASQVANLLIQSGLPATEAALDEAIFQLTQSRFTAPFSGIAADVKVQEAQSVNSGEEICTLIDLNSLEAEFSLLEQEINTTDKKIGIYVSPITQPDLKIPATLDIINPRVDPGGLLRVRARLQSIPKGTRLYPGMNVAVTLEGKSPAVIIVPKSALVNRSGRSLVFTYEPESRRAQWKYVTVSHENDESIGISEGLKPGEQVIINGNLTLDHDSEVRVE